MQLLFQEVGAVDIGPDGIVREPKKQIFVDDKDLGTAEPLILKPRDIVLAVKGSVGIVGFIPMFEDNPNG